MVAAENGASDCITQSVPPAGNIERQHGSSEKIGIETQHALYSLAQMRDFQTLNLKKSFSTLKSLDLETRLCFPS